MRPLESPEEVFEVAFAYMKSKAMFAALHLGVFDALGEGEATFEELLAATGAEDRGLETLLAALVSIGLIEQTADEGGRLGSYRNAPASQAMLVASADGGFGDYCRKQVDRQMYPFLHDIAEVLRGRRDTVPFVDYETWFRDDDHSGPLLPALWALQHAAFTPGGVALTPGFVSDALAKAGLVDALVRPFVPGMTRLVVARKPPQPATA